MRLTKLNDMDTEQQTEEPQKPPSVDKRLTTSSTDKYVAGVAGGIAKYLDIDVRLVRAAFVIASFFGGFGLLVYVVAWIVLPAEDSPPDVDIADRMRDNWGWLVLIGLTVVFFGAFNDLDHGPSIWGLFLIGAGIWLLTTRDRDRKAMGAANTQTSAAHDATTVSGAMNLNDTTEMRVPTSQAAQYQRNAPKQRREPSFLAPLAFGLSFVAAGVMAVLERLNVVDITLQQAVAVISIVIGFALLIGAWVGRAKVLLGVAWILIVMLAFTSVSGEAFRGGIGDRQYAPRQVADIESPYRLGIGQLNLDLSNVTGARGIVYVKAEVGVGELIVTLPYGAAYQVKGSAGVGEVQLLDREPRDGVNPEDEASQPQAFGAATYVIDAHSGIGHVVVESQSRRQGFFQ